MKLRTNILIAGAIVLLTGCGRVVELQSGKEDVAYLIFTSPQQHIGDKVNVVIDDKTQFDAKVVNVKKANRKGTQYGVATGNRQVTVKHEGQTLYNKKVFLSSQQNKIITLP